MPTRCAVKDVDAIMRYRAPEKAIPFPHMILAVVFLIHSAAACE